MSEDNRKPRIERRAFLRNVGIGAAGAAAAVPLAALPAEAKETAETRSKQRYQETDHVKTYYRVNGY
ncbi:twin-arginine translocation signal domain-containing protein [Arenibaculum pallidiluteum]|uniref:twin-arginine translocation signal domain-containing protein n=1 Tax=Arenibaculum pallidiluteum TaxID=2812559 RepID=UPI001A95B536|nr:twin-arginine translocation signal domain-containing protein [Arenibaculum pallidiluteum]